MKTAEPAGLNKRLKVIEFFAGIGGMSAAWREAGRSGAEPEALADAACRSVVKGEEDEESASASGSARAGTLAGWPGADVVAAVEIDRDAASVYRANFAAPVHEREIASLTDEWLESWRADVWWLSPPCTPFTRRGKQRDLDDPRNRGLLRLVKAIPVVRPPILAIENVVGFETSATFGLLRKTLSVAGYHVQWCRLCPTELGWPNRRPRIYVLASLQPLRPWQPLQRRTVTLAQVLDSVAPAGADEAAALCLEPETAKRYEFALHRVDRNDPSDVTACFTRSYGRTLVRSGSWLVEDESLRRFSPAEVAALLGFPPDFRWPAALDRRRRWQLLGNSLSLPAVRYVLGHVAPM